MESKRSEYGRLVGITVTVKLNFNERINYIISKATRKVTVLPRIMSYMSLSKNTIEFVFNSQFSYFPFP